MTEIVRGSVVKYSSGGKTYHSREEVLRAGLDPDELEKVSVDAGNGGDDDVWMSRFVEEYHVTRVSGPDAYGHATRRCDEAGCAAGEELYLGKTAELSLVDAAH